MSHERKPACSCRCHNKLGEAVHSNGRLRKGSGEMQTWRDTIPTDTDISPERVQDTVIGIEGATTNGVSSNEAKLNIN